MFALNDATTPCIAPPSPLPLPPRLLSRGFFALPWRSCFFFYLFFSFHSPSLHRKDIIKNSWAIITSFSRANIAKSVPSRRRYVRATVFCSSCCPHKSEKQRRTEKATAQQKKRTRFSHAATRIWPRTAYSSHSACKPLGCHTQTDVFAP